MGELVKQCADVQGCGPQATCVDACAVAAANGNSVGCDFYAAMPGPEYGTRGSCFAAYVVNNWTSPATIAADYGSMTLDLTTAARKITGSGATVTYQPLTNGQLAPGETAVVFLSHYPSGDLTVVDCPATITAAVELNTTVDRSGLGSAFHIQTSVPVAAYDVYPYGDNAVLASATLLVPTAAWGTSYLAADGFASDPNLSAANGAPYVQVVAMQDSTHVTITPTDAIESGAGIGASAAGQSVTFTLARGQLLQLLQDAELAGSTIKADKPIGVWGGSSCMNVPVGYSACDSAHQQLPPATALGHEYAAVGYRDRVPGANEQIPYTLVGAVDGTLLQYDPSTLPGAPLSLQHGQSATFNVSTPFVVRSQDAAHPFYFAAHMTSATFVNGNSNGDGDADYVSVLPAEQHLSRYVFVTDPNYANTHLVLTRKAVAGSYHDVTLDCGGVVTGWTDIGSAGAYQYARVDLVISGTDQNGCSNGTRIATSAAPFGLTVWGWNPYVSYAYLAGMNLRAINSVTLP
jgi:hypothetical protein